MTANKLVSVLNTVDESEIFFGPQGFKQITSEEELNAAQLGFGVNESGQPIANTASNNIGDWQTAWLVFARDTELGDPYFVDTLKPELPVYTGFLGDNGWEEELVASSIEAYVLCMQLLLKQGLQTQAQFVPDDNTVVDADVLADMQQQLIKISGSEHFWQMFFRCYQDWLLDE